MHERAQSQENRMMSVQQTDALQCLCRRFNARESLSPTLLLSTRAKSSFFPPEHFRIHHVICYASFLRLCGYFMDSSYLKQRRALATRPRLLDIPEGAGRIPAAAAEVLSFSANLDLSGDSSKFSLTNSLSAHASTSETESRRWWRAVTSKKALQKRNRVAAWRHVMDMIPAGSEAGQNHILRPNPL